VALTTNPNLEPRLKKKKNYALLLLWAFMAGYFFVTYER
jgi:hypothetical protein